MVPGLHGRTRFLPAGHCRHRGGRFSPLSTIMNRKPRLASSFVLIGFLSLLGVGCSSTPEQIEVITEPSAALIFVNGVFVGESPRKVGVSFDKSERIYIQTVRKGFEPTLDIYTDETLPEDGRRVLRLRRN